LPGLPNLHSHAFQRAMAGLAEHQTNPEDSFWTWRETMYRFAARFDPGTLHAVAAQLYAEMLEAGYTTVCEFHYLHHAPDGRPYADPAAMSRALISAARDTGIRLTLLPVLYMSGGFDGRALSERQQRFGHGIDAYLRLLDTLRRDEHDGLRIGCALHSLRAVPAEAMREVLSALPADSPVHIHIAEQIGEVQDCISIRGAPPVEWLLANAKVDAHWTLVHATHLTDAEVQGIAHSGATPRDTRRIRARIFWLHDKPLTKGDQILIRLGTRESRANVVAIEKAVDPGELSNAQTKSIARNHVGEIDISLAQPVAVEGRCRGRGGRRRRAACSPG